MLMIATGIIASSGLFYFASSREAPGWTRPICQYGDTFCQHPQWLFYAGALTLIWALFLKVDRI